MQCIYTIIMVNRVIFIYEDAEMSMNDAYESSGYWMKRFGHLDFAIVNRLYKDAIKQYRDFIDTEAELINCRMISLLPDSVFKEAKEKALESIDDIEYREAVKAFWDV